MPKTPTGQAQPGHGRFSHERIRSKSDSTVHAIFEQPVDDVHGWTVKVGVASGAQAYRRPSVQDVLEFETAHNGAGCAHVVGGGFRSLPNAPKGIVRVLQKAEQGCAAPIESIRGCGREDGIALDLLDIEHRADAVYDGIEKLAQNFVAGRHFAAEVNQVRPLDTVKERRVAGYIGQKQIPLDPRLFVGAAVALEGRSNRHGRSV